LYLLDAWLNTGMAAPYVMASTTWGTPPMTPVTDVISQSIRTWTVDKSGNLVTESSSFKATATVGIKVHVTDSASATISGCQVYVQIRNSAGTLVTSLQGFTDTNGVAILKWKTPRNQPLGAYKAKVVDIQKSGYKFNPALGVTEVTFNII
ncbi:MAG: hypothetical protein ACPL7K_08205, partial [Armatimonadota bacterium]